MKYPDDMKIVKFETHELKPGDTITLSRAMKGEVSRWLVADVDHSLVWCIILLDRTGNKWTGEYKPFAKCELDTNRWRKIA